MSRRLLSSAGPDSTDRLFKMSGSQLTMSAPPTFANSLGPYFMAGLGKRPRLIHHREDCAAAYGRSIARQP